ncbi:N-ethylmaleimide reductase [Rhizomicrobium palustre]|uniref:N-ethylmaleimide reductase n=1 Tax=Rhizomicrobium palustre TaxID=189966 RepID=A0A846MVL6_9PROT|nr:alkene reductase [Rhizomicrobium palustre]NIK87047.1 N-ethylmaleimide reductase [Rhizomicrobium palustre]
MSQALLSPYKLGSLELPNRVVMAPMTRNRADNPGNLPTGLTAQYYAQRATAGLIISEGTFVSTQGIGFINVPGMYTAEQAEAWKQVTTAIHAAGGRIFAQLWHVGAISHPDLLGGALPVAPSAINPETKAYTQDGFKPTVTPRALETEEVAAIVQDFRLAAARAAAAGFDGVELHGANAYLIQQFLSASTNKRTDRYGGSIENRTRFLFEVIEAVRQEFPADRIGLKLNPAADGFAGVLFDDETLAVYRHIVARINASPIGYLHITEPTNAHEHLPKELFAPSVAAYFRPLYHGTIIAGVDYSQESANRALEEGYADLVAFGRAYIANPDLVARFESHAPLAAADRATFYTGGAKGYVDYPAYSPAQTLETSAQTVAPGERFFETRAKTRAGK